MSFFFSQESKFPLIFLRAQNLAAGSDAEMNRNTSRADLKTDRSRLRWIDPSIKNTDRNNFGLRVRRST